MSASRLDSAELRKRIGALTGRSLVAFAAACCEHLFPSYVDFAGRYGSEENVNLLRRALDVCWNSVLTQNTKEPSIDDIAREARNLVVDPNEFPAEFAAENASAAIVLTLRLCQQPDARAVIEVADRSFETAEGLAIRRRGIHGAFNPADLDAELATDPLIQGELKWQEETVRILEASPLSEKLVLRLREKSAQSGA